MVADLPGHERLLVGAAQLGPTGPAAEAAAPMPTGHVYHEYGRNVAIIGAAEEADLPAAAPAPAALAPENLSLTERFGAAACAQRHSEAFADAKANRPRQAEEWDFDEGDRSADIATADEPPGAPAAAPARPTSDRMMGRIAVGLVLVSGTPNGRGFTEDEKLKVIAEVQHGLSWLSAQSAQANVTWVHDIQDIEVDVADDYSSGSYEQMEAPWRDPALQAMGFPPGMPGVRQYIESLRKTLNTDRTYCAFFTKYPTRHFAYASVGGPRMVMQYENDGWGPDNIDRVFAHETGHIFMAPDEYANSNCNCGGSWGHFGQPNGNCANCAPNGGVQCIMRSNDWAICPFTIAHFGFPEGSSFVA